MRLFVDWDGTVTVQDSLVQVIHEFGDPAILAELEPRVGVDLTLHEEIALEFEAVTTPLDEVVEWVLENVDVRPGLAELAELRPVIVSAGFHELIEPVLRREGIELEVLANRVEARPGRVEGRLPRRRSLRQLRRALQARRRRRCAVRVRRRRLLGPLRCGRGGPGLRARLARAPLDEVGVAYEPFRDLSDVASPLGGPGAHLSSSCEPHFARRRDEGFSGGVTQSTRST